jgi:hypothetical protein
MNLRNLWLSPTSEFSHRKWSKIWQELHLWLCFTTSNRTYILKYSSQIAVCLLYVKVDTWCLVMPTGSLGSFPALFGLECWLWHSCVTVYKLFITSAPQFLHLWNEDNSDTLPSVFKTATRGKVALLYLSLLLRKQKLWENSSSSPH